MRGTLSRLTGAGTALILCLLAACGDDNSGGLPAGPPTRSGAYALLPIESIAAIADYIGTTGLDGQTYDLTDPAGCEALREEALAATSDEEREQIAAATAGRLCISRSESSIDGDRAEAILREYTSEAAWAVQLGPSADGWEVTAAAAIP
jgi:hypothetical protein